MALTVHSAKHFQYRDMAHNVSRRSFLKAGLLGTLVLVAAGSLYRSQQRGQPAAGFILDGAARAVLVAVIPIVLKDAIEPTAAGIDNAMLRVRDAIAGLPLATQEEVQDLFGLLTLAPSRRFLAGIPNDWPQARPADIETFLQSWRFSRFMLLQSAYHALHDLITGAWYADPSTWAAIGYPGPMKELS